MALYKGPGLGRRFVAGNPPEINNNDGGGHARTGGRWFSSYRECIIKKRVPISVGARAKGYCGKGCFVGRRKGEWIDSTVLVGGDTVHTNPAWKKSSSSSVPLPSASNHLRRRGRAHEDVKG